MIDVASRLFRVSQRNEPHVVIALHFFNNKQNMSKKCEKSITVSSEEALRFLSSGGRRFVLTSTTGKKHRAIISRICSNCNAGYGINPPISGPAQRCARCKNVWYCDRQCQKSHWREHKKSCQELHLQRKTEKKEWKSVKSQRRHT